MASSSGSQNKPPPPPVPPRPVMVPRPTMLQYEPHESLKISRCRFMVLVYLLFVVFLLLALIQWELVSYYKPLAHFFLANYWLSAVCMLISVPLLAVFLMVRKARYIPIFSWLLLCVIVAYCSELNFLLYFTVTAILMVTCVLIGSFIPCDLTANVAVLFLFIMYHAQLIRGGRYAELYTTDGLFAVIILFCHFCIILMLFCFGDWLKTKDVEDYDIDEGTDEPTKSCAASSAVIGDFLGQTTQDVRRLLSPLVDIIITSIILDHTQMTTTAKVAHK
nr:uncharacterized protein LOC108065759 [Drosophila takahashii]